MPSLEAEFKEINDQIEDPNLWNNPELAKEIMQNKRRVELLLEAYQKLSTSFEDAETLAELASEDESLYAEAYQELKRLQPQIDKMETQLLLGGEADPNNAFIEIHAGAGGTESCDWASMLMRMYLRWAERVGFKTEILEETRGDEAGIKSVTIKVKGDYAYGYGRTESGVHRLVRISPFDSQSRRHTSFSSVFVYPEVDDNIDIDIEEKDLRIDTYRASGAGGQHVNTTDSAVRITHVPTNIVVQCQNQRSQHKNKDEAFKMLKARLYEHEMQKQLAEKDAQQAAKGDNGWGNQIRSYVLHPYKMVKDLRTTVETSDTDGVLDGDLDKFIQATLSYVAQKK